MSYRFGPVLDPHGTSFRLWSPTRADVDVLVEGNAPVRMTRTDDGFLTARVPDVGAGAQYQFCRDGLIFPDPASRQQQTGSSGWSIVREPFAPTARRETLAPWHQSIIAEVHIGTASPQGTFAGLGSRLQHFKDAGYTSIEIMPVNVFPGQRNWGYDGTLIFAPSPAYGTPDDLKALVDHAHVLGLSVVLDVVYNHFGEVDNFLRQHTPEFFADDVKTPWGPAVNFREPMVRQFYFENACLWVQEYDFDGLRLDSVHELHTEQKGTLLHGIAKLARRTKPDAHLIAENAENLAAYLTRDDHDQPHCFSAQWNDDYHHVLNFLVTGERKQGYDDSDRDPIADLEKALIDGFVHDGEAEEDSDGRTRNEPASALPPAAFISYAQNHDQIGNRPDGKRLPARVDADRLDFVHFLTMLSPQIPLLFQGEEGQMTCQFLFFVDLPEASAEAKRKDRYEQMSAMFNEDIKDGDLPDPNAPDTFEKSKLDWDAFSEPKHARALERFRELTGLRRDHIWPLTASKCLEAKSARQGDAFIVSCRYQTGTLSMAVNANPSAADLHCLVNNQFAGTGRWTIDGDKLQLGPFSAIAWIDL